jgi:hypothetical protein
MERHKIDAPESIEGMTSAGDEDRSNISHFYPSVKKDNRPLIMSDIERYRQHDAIIIAATRKIHRYVILLGLLLALPFVLFVNGATYFFFSIDASSAVIMSTLILFAGMLWIGVWILCFRAIIKRFRIHGLKAGGYLLFGMLFLLVISPILSQLAIVSQNPSLNALAFSGYFTIASIAITEIILATATHGFASKARHD